MRKRCAFDKKAPIAGGYITTSVKEEGVTTSFIPRGAESFRTEAGRKIIKG
ncbi:MAG: hypothetical protein H6Q52_1088 [Deltaproteobacteria bacterium]|nr:hypothetical protein [Deltaproteobacteria bacterium]